MNNSMQYDILKDENPDKLVEKVNAALADGWEPLGGVSEAKASTGQGTFSQWAQAMKKGRTQAEEDLRDIYSDLQDLVPVKEPRQ